MLDWAYEFVVGFDTSEDEANVARAHQFGPFALVFRGSEVGEVAKPIHAS